MNELEISDVIKLFVGRRENMDQAEQMECIYRETYIYQALVKQLAEIENEMSKHDEFMPGDRNYPIFFTLTTELNALLDKSYPNAR